MHPFSSPLEPRSSGLLRLVSLCLLVSLVLLGAQASARADAGFGEIGDNDFRITFMNGTGSPDFDAEFADVVYNPNADEYLVVYRAYGSRDCFGLTGTDWEVYRQRVGAGGQLLGPPLRISDMGPPCNPTYQVLIPAVAYNSRDDEYLVVWSGAEYAVGEYEIFGQRLDGQGEEIGGDDFRISEAGGTGDPAYAAKAPAVVWNAVRDEYLVVWKGNDDEGGLVPQESEIFGQLLDSAGAEIGVDDFRISDMGGLGDAEFFVGNSSVAWNAQDNEYLVAWYGAEEVDGVVYAAEIYGQRLNENGTAQGVNDFPISDVGDTPDAPFVAGYPSVAWNSTSNQYLVVWYGSDEVGGQVEDEFEIFGQLLSNVGAEVGANDFRISDMCGIGTATCYASDPKVVWADGLQEYLVSWWGIDDAGLLSPNEAEIFGQRLDLNGSEVGDNDFRISDMGGTGDNPFSAFWPRIAWNEQDDQYLVVWFGDDDVGGLVDDEREIFGQRLGDECPIFSDGFESGDLAVWDGFVGG